jgi:hypothetical protein
MKPSFLLALAAGLSLSACSVREARIAVPSEFATTAERLELRGMGGGTRGTFRLAGAQGAFTRLSDRLGLFDPLLVRRSGHGTFTLSASDLGPELSGRCAYRARDVNAGPIAISPGRLVYSCRFSRDGRPLHAELLLEDPSSAFGTLHGRAERVGYLFLGGREIGIRSLHRDREGGLAAPTALGYMFEAEGRDIGAIDLNGGTKTLFVPHDPALREAVLAASLALAVFWDPAVVQPD